MLGPVMIALVLALAWLDQYIDARPLPAGLRWLSERDTFPPGTVAFGTIAVLSFFASRELARILRDKGIAASTRITCGAALVGLTVSCLVPSGIQTVTSVAIVSTAAATVLLVSLIFYARRGTFEGVVAASGGAVLSFVYLGLMFGFLLAIRREHSVWVLVWALLLPKACDIGAYFTGRMIGRHKLIPWLSPGKTWEGLIGGMVLAAVAGAIGLWCVNDWDTPRAWVILMQGAIAGAIFGAVGQGGDLVASLLKRDAGIKDSGTILPGFGGMLDVLDSPLLVAPVAYWWLVVFGSTGGGLE